MNPWPMAEPDREGAELPLLNDLDRLAGACCVACRQALCPHQVLFSIALGFKDAPRCLGCLARGLDRPPLELRDDLYRYIQYRTCFERAWREANRREAMDLERPPSCLWPAQEPAPAAAPIVPQEITEVEPQTAAITLWDAGDMSCGDLVLALRGRLGTLAPGAVLKVIARDPAAPEDLPSWCRLTGHRLLSARHPEYHIQRKGG